MQRCLDEAQGGCARPQGGGVARVAAANEAGVSQVRIRTDGGPCPGRDADLGNDADSSVGGVGDEVSDVRIGVEAVSREGLRATRRSDVVRAGGRVARAAHRARQLSPTLVRRGKPGTGMRHPRSSVRRQCSTLKRYRAMRERKSSIAGTGQKVWAESTRSPRHENAGRSRGSCGRGGGIAVIGAPYD